MIKHNIYAGVLCSVLCIMILLSALVSVSAAGCEFELGDVEAKEGRLFALSLDCKGGEVCAFISQIEYDPSVLEYRSAKALDKNAKFSINDTEEGKLRLVYLCEEGINSTYKQQLIEFKFKALQGGQHKLSISVSQVVDSNSSDVQISSTKGAVVTVAANSAADNHFEQTPSDKTEKSETKSNSVLEETTKTEDNADNLSSYTGVEAVKHDLLLIITSVIVVLTLLCLVGFCAYKYGTKVSIKKKEQEHSDDFSSSEKKI